ncbi:helix-turn-helix domain-containing protein [candidate division KSB1 bacterium]|nr:helix-turn-helix domain-containing protein [candidate division KSB1 bacterium]NIV68552.1 helix-turn-helix domain-containing protein [Phycisphaerae bacterium]NIU23149.1 helix-turn-helix domain-containing protein [candidate division KSB1 bacterium]NIU90111.1 helix-turn-helix domain-containing protein [candidate division KSB1 bacterium]NIW17004.1 helix-turn-helix domain-containing protein [candidate division KSB1 bacterium]
MAQTLGISPRWLRTVCRRAFGKSFTQLMRQIRVYQALCFMKHTTLDNWDIAMQLNYSEESNMARDFRKELGYCPSEARIRLSEITPQELLL